MNDQCIEEKVQAGVVKKRDKAMWMDRSGKIVSDKSLAFGCNVTHDLIHSDWCFVGD